jgi:hypothetical protein
MPTIRRQAVVFTTAVRLPYNAADLRFRSYARSLLAIVLPAIWPD